MRFSRQTPVASTGAIALKKHGTGCFMDSYTATAVCLRLRYLYVYGLLLRKNSIIV
ncbi:unknown [Corallococcus sp. CAG:1435]|nr:unknown [Corallococcus sp. CAG:1435]